MSASPVPASRPARGGALDALRFVASALVVVFHFGDAAPISLQSMHGFLGRGYLATDFFLMLSGFVLMYMPIEPAYIEAMRHDRELFDHGYRQGIEAVRMAIGPTVPTVHLRGGREIAAFLAQLPATPATRPSSIN